MALWSGRFEEGVSEFTQEFGASLPVDKAMYKQDIAGSMAHARMLADQGVISHEDAEAITAGLAQIERDIEEGNFIFDINNEDIHISIEAVLTERIGAAGARLHTGRSRNDQVITDTRLYAKELCRELMGANLKLRKTLLALAAQNEEVLLPGYTHLQHAQPVLLAHHFMAYYWMFTRDFNRLRQAFDAADMNPLGSAALAGTTYPLDRDATTRALGFAAPIPNSLDAVLDWFVDHAAEEEPRFRGAHPRQVGPCGRRSCGASRYDEIVAAGLQQGSPGRQRGRDRCCEDAL